MSEGSARRVLIAIHDLGGGGAERVAIGLAQHLHARGVATAILTLGESEDFYPLPSGIVRLHSPRPAGAPLVANLRRVVRLRRTIRAFAPTAVAAFMTTTSVLVLLATRGLGVPVVVSERIWPPAMPIGAAWRGLRRATYRFADGLVVLTGRTRAWALAELGLAPERVTVVPNPVQLPLPDHAPRVEPPAGAFVLAAGRLAPQKNFAALIEACAGLHAAPRLAIIGEGEERAALVRLAEVRGIDLQLPGRVGNPADWYRAARCLVLTSRFEGFPNVLLEALSHGCPVVSVDCDAGPREIVRDGVDGLLVAPGDVAALTGALHRMLTDDDLHARFTRAAPEVADRFSAERVYGAWDRLLGR